MFKAVALWSEIVCAHSRVYRQRFSTCSSALVQSLPFSEIPNVREACNREGRRFRCSKRLKMIHSHADAAVDKLSSLFLSSICGLEQRLILIILNFRLPAVTFSLWKHAQLKIVADGGANRLYDALSHIHGEDGLQPSLYDYVPDVIKGDLDSIRPEVLSFYRSLGSRIVDKSDDQDTSDLQKCILCALTQIERDPNRLKGASIFAVGAFGGRLDHVLSSLNTLYKHKGYKILLCGDGNLVRLLPPGHSHLSPDRALEGPSCGLISLGSPATASSTGLQWNLDGTRLEVAGLQSTSNLIIKDCITVDSDQPLLWMTQFQDIETQSAACACEK